MAGSRLIRARQFLEQPPTTAGKCALAQRDQLQREAVDRSTGRRRNGGFDFGFQVAVRRRDRTKSTGSGSRRAA
jgi:hypothetical protein